MPKFLESLRCSCGSAIFSQAPVIITSPKSVSSTGIMHFKCLVCMRDFVYDRDESILKSITREDGKKFLVDCEKRIREPESKPKQVTPEKTPEPVFEAHDPLVPLTPEEIDEGSFGD